MHKLAVVAIGGNSLIKDKEHLYVEDQYKAICETVKHIVDIIEMGINVVVTHGNGPQVGFIMRRSEIAEEMAHMHPVPLVSCDADTQGAIGYQIQQAMHNEFYKRGLMREAVTIVTQVVVDPNDPAFVKPSKPIGSFYTSEQVESITKEHPDWQLMKDAGRGYRRVVPSPMPVEIVEYKAIDTLVKVGYSVIAVGGGGIPVIKKNNQLLGVNAVIDKDFASALLASALNADYFIISTGVEQVYINYNSSEQKALEKIYIHELDSLISEGHFHKGSMLPKVQAAAQFVKSGGQKAIITTYDSMVDAIKGYKGSTILQ